MIGMNKTELNQLYWLNKETAQLQKELLELRQRGINILPVLSDMPKGGGSRDKLSDYVAEVVILEETIKLNLQRIFYERNRLERFIADIPESDVRLIMRLRHINGMTWDSIAVELGYTESGVRKRYNRYFKKVSAFSDSKCDIV